MIYADALKATTNGQTSTALFEESIGVCEVVLEGASSTLVELRNTDTGTATGVCSLAIEELLQ